jgi:hypothetical protein
MVPLTMNWETVVGSAFRCNIMSQAVALHCAFVFPAHIWTTVSVDSGRFSGFWRCRMSVFIVAVARTMLLVLRD